MKKRFFRGADHWISAVSGRGRGAENDDNRQPEAKHVLREAFAKANLPAKIEVYAGAIHGWCPPDSKVYDEAKAEQAWSRLLALFKTTLA